jgi:hypothetical protein
LTPNAERPIHYVKKTLTGNTQTRTSRKIISKDALLSVFRLSPENELKLAMFRLVQLESLQNLLVEKAQSPECEYEEEYEMRYCQSQDIKNH